MAHNGDIVVAGIPGEEATVKAYLAEKGKVTLRPANPALRTWCSSPAEVTVFGKLGDVHARCERPGRISLVTLGVSDLERSGTFYDVSGWGTVGHNEGVISTGWPAPIACPRSPSLAEDVPRGTRRSGFSCASLADRAPTRPRSAMAFAHLVGRRRDRQGTGACPPGGAVATSRIPTGSSGGRVQPGLAARPPWAPPAGSTRPVAVNPMPTRTGDEPGSTTATVWLPSGRS